LSGRKAALTALAAQRRKGIRLDTALAEAARGLSPRDAALAARLCYGTVQNRDIIDLGLNLKKTQPQVLDILRISAYQLWFLDRVPRRALTDEAVRLCKKTAPHAAGMVNAVLRRLPDTPPVTDDLSVKYSLPRWFCERMAGILPEDELESFFASCNAIPPIYIVGNPLRGGVYGSYTLSGSAELEEILKSGRGIVADPAAKHAVDTLAPQPGSRVWDACAAPGGKTAMIAMAMGNDGYILATDKSAEKLPMIEQALSRIGADIVAVRQADAAAYTPDGLFDCVLCDVPCSGFGVLRKKPDIRYRTEVAHFPALQLAILQNASRAVKGGGTLVYCTCTLLPEENEGVINTFIHRSGGFIIESTDTLWPHRRRECASLGDTDGFFICRMKKKK
jgi:16S rRNA (cytosine967-C5)-methyltransferase